MNQQHIADLSAELIMKYYDNDYMPFLLHMDDEALWYGPAEGQFIRGRDEMIRIWQAEVHSLQFTPGNMEVTHISSNTTYCDVMLSFPVTTHYPDREDVTLNQRILMTWCERTVEEDDGSREKEPRILVCHISNPHAKHDDDVIYPNNFHEVYNKHFSTEPHGERIHFHGLDRSDYFFLSDTIIRVEAAHMGKHSILYTDEGSVEVMSTVTALEKRYGHLFIRCHQSYLVNPLYIRNIRRFRVTLTDGVELPIPEKKYTAFKQKAMKTMKKKST